MAGGIKANALAPRIARELLPVTEDVEFRRMRELRSICQKPKSARGPRKGRRRSNPTIDPTASDDGCAEGLPSKRWAVLRAVSRPALGEPSSPASPVASARRTLPGVIGGVRGPPLESILGDGSD